MTKPALHVFVGRTSVGSFMRSSIEEDTYLFGYRAGTTPANAVSLTMPIRADQYDTMSGLLPIFEMNLPEGSLRERLRLQFAKAQFALQVTYACTIGNGDAHLKNFAVLYEHAEGLVKLAPAYDLVATLPYIPRDTLALTMNGSKQFPDRPSLLRVCCESVEVHQDCHTSTRAPSPRASRASDGRCRPRSAARSILCSQAPRLCTVRGTLEQLDARRAQAPCLMQSEPCTFGHRWLRTVRQ
jgi:HipA-like protein